jgi:hypothetical protein
MRRGVTGRSSSGTLGCADSKAAVRLVSGLVVNTAGCGVISVLGAGIDVTSGPLVNANGFGGISMLGVVTSGPVAAKVSSD